MNESRLYLIENDHKDRMSIKELKVSTYINKVRNFIVKRVLHVSEDKTCWKDSCWSVGIVFTLKKRGM